MKRALPVFLCLLLLTTATMASARDVYVTANGKKYHTEDCRWVKNREVKKMTEEEAVKKGLTPCGACLKEGEASLNDGSAKKAVESKEGKGKK